MAFLRSTIEVIGMKSRDGKLYDDDTLTKYYYDK